MQTLHNAVVDNSEFEVIDGNFELQDDAIELDAPDNRSYVYFYLLHNVVIYVGMGGNSLKEPDDGFYRAKDLSEHKSVVAKYINEKIQIVIADSSLSRHDALVMETVFINKFSLLSYNLINKVRSVKDIVTFEITKHNNFLKFNTSEDLAYGVDSSKSFVYAYYTTDRMTGKLVPVYVGIGTDTAKTVGSYTRAHQLSGHENVAAKYKSEDLRIFILAKNLSRTKALRLESAIMTQLMNLNYKLENLSLSDAKVSSWRIINEGKLVVERIVYTTEEGIQRAINSKLAKIEQRKTPEGKAYGAAYKRTDRAKELAQKLVSTPEARGITKS